MSPRRLFRAAATAEAVTWALLLAGMVLKYGTRTTELGVQVFGMVHGVVFIAYCLAVLVVGTDQRWSTGRLALGLVSAVPPFATVWFDRRAERDDVVGDAWRLRSTPPATVLERPVAWLLRHPARGLSTGAAAVAVLTGLALVVGPPVG